MQLEVLTRQPAIPAVGPPLLFVHGAWHGAWCWDVHFLPYFAEQGFAVTALSIRGHGASADAPRVRGKRINHYVADLAEVVASFPTAPILIGHSMGGLIVQRYLEGHAVPAAILLSTVPKHGVILTTLRTLRRHPVPFLMANLTTRLWPIIGTPALSRDALFSAALPDDAARRYHQQLQDESYLAYLDMMLFALPHPARVRARGTPLLIVGGANDRLFSPSEIQATARAYGTQAVILPDMAHDVMLEPGWQRVADTVIAWLRARPTV